MFLVDGDRGFPLSAVDLERGGLRGELTLESLTGPRQGQAVLWRQLERGGPLGKDHLEGARGGLSKQGSTLKQLDRGNLVRGLREQANFRFTQQGELKLSDRDERPGGSQAKQPISPAQWGWSGESYPFAVIGIVSEEDSIERVGQARGAGGDLAGKRGFLGLGIGNLGHLRSAHLFRVRAGLAESGPPTPSGWGCAGISPCRLASDWAANIGS